jgi:hypothetical protein
MLSPERWLPSVTLDNPDFLHFRCWLSSLATVRFGCGVAPMWPEPVREQRTERTDHDDIQALASVMRSPGPSTVLEMFWSDSRRGSQSSSGRRSSKRSSFGRLRHDGGSQREIDLVTGS